MRTSIMTLTAMLVIAGAVLGCLAAAEAAPVYQQCAQVQITSPDPEAELRGIIAIEGSASITDFQFYKIEFSTGRQPALWRAISDVKRNPVIDTVLDRWNTPARPDGEYNLKLTTVDRRGQEVCRYTVRNLILANTEPTTTPTPEVPPTLPGPTATSTPRATATPALPTPTPTIAAIIPTRRSAFPELDTIRDTVSKAFDLQRLQELVVLSAGTTAAVFVFIGLITALRRLI
ncbi:MAG: hypothetical protein MAG451_02327 [Anaerolineales bacterium]|nr:hypothetical protein [Anaerolineales bacterium]